MSVGGRGFAALEVNAGYRIEKSNLVIYIAASNVAARRRSSSRADACAGGLVGGWVTAQARGSGGSSGSGAAGTHFTQFTCFTSP